VLTFLFSTKLCAKKQTLNLAQNPQLRLHFVSERYLLFLFIKFTIIFTIVSFSSGLLIAIINVNATNVLSAIRFVPFLVLNISFFSRKYRNKNAAILLFPSENEWFLTTKYNKLEAFSSTLGYKSTFPKV